MREIKFRAKTINGNEWIESMTIANGIIKRKERNYFIEVGNDKWKGIITETIGQYTGLKDCNGKEIYEGDIIFREDGKHRVVVYQAPSFIMKRSMKAKTWTGFILHPDELQFERVIGNIYENPELLAKDLEVTYEEVKPIKP